MDLFFADDARQRRPFRPGMGPLVAIGGLHVPGHEVKDLERRIGEVCEDAGFPPGEAFKWSPGKDLWMHDNLIEEAREEFFVNILTEAESSGVRAIVVVEDEARKTATDAPNAEVDVTRLFLERVDNQLRRNDSDGIVVIARPSGGRKDEDKFLAECLETLQQGTDYVKPERIAINVLSTSFKLVRLLQLADVVASCTLAAVAGETKYAPPVFSVIRRLLHKEAGRIGGVGLKLHPDYLYANLYHWLLGDNYFKNRPLPSPDFPYFSDSETFD